MRMYMSGLYADSTIKRLGEKLYQIFGLHLPWDLGSILYAIQDVYSGKEIRERLG